MLPSFGPSWINFYGAPREYKMVDYMDKLNYGVGEGAAYRGRLLMSMKTELLDAEAGGASTVYVKDARITDKVMQLQLTLHWYTSHPSLVLLPKSASSYV